MQYGLTNKKKFPPKWEDDKMAGEEWIRLFMGRHNKSLSLRKPEPTSLSRKSPIFPRVHYKDFMTNGAPPGTTGAANRSGWSTEAIFLKSVKQFANDVKPSKEERVLLVLDNHETHLSVEAVEYASEVGIVMLTFPPRTSNKFQPLNLTVYGPLQTCCDQAVDAWLKNNPGRTFDIYSIAEMLGSDSDEDSNDISLQDEDDDPESLLDIVEQEIVNIQDQDQFESCSSEIGGYVLIQFPKEMAAPDHFVGNIVSKDVSDSEFQIKFYKRNEISRKFIQQSHQTYDVNEQDIILKLPKPIPMTSSNRVADQLWFPVDFTKFKVK
ncbi:hypothetical protein NQ314_020695 [Rhamnusium bicolor]|uniref:DDE-1 domain-containing protein n=1 Tax=Rhamnusium bicolor TaxID=1586634 RepID=A0AAV8WJB3_9CUCU|nr:hypothetical protein NQ314_020695 [Rhamnusium bicolor]